MDTSNLMGLLSSPSMGIAQGLLSGAGPSQTPQGMGQMAGQGALSALKRQMMMNLMAQGNAGSGLKPPQSPSLPSMGGGTGLIPGQGNYLGSLLNINANPVYIPPGMRSVSQPDWGGVRG
jgi:hypothetical protein